MNHSITLSRAIQMTTLFRENREEILGEAFRGKNILPYSETFDRAAFDALLAQPGCVSIRIYYGMDEDLKVHVISVGVDENNVDLLPSSGTIYRLASLEEEPTDAIVEVGKRCPEDCPPPSPLNP